MRNRIYPSHIVTIKIGRDSNIEFLRLISMMLIMVLHAGVLANGLPTQTDMMSNIVPSSTRILFHSLAIVAVNVFVLISGWFGIKLKTKGILNILFQCLFYAILSFAFMMAFFPEQITTAHIIKSFYPGEGYWFVPAYIGLMLLSPVLNAFVERVDEKSIRICLSSFLIFQIAYGWLLLDEAHFINGYSLISFIFLYLLARYTRMFSPSWSVLRPRTYVLVYVGIAILITAIITIAYRFFGNSIGMVVSDKMFAYNNPLIIAGSVSFLLAFAKFDLGVRPWINWLSSSCFSIYLVHCQIMILPLYCRWMHYLFSQYSSITCLLVMVTNIFGIALICILLDKTRIYAWDIIMKRYESKQI